MSRGARERERERERASERTRIQWPSVLGAPGQRRRTSKYHLSESRRAFTCARPPTGPLSLGRLGRIRSFGRIRVFPLYFLRARESLLTVAATRQVRAEARASPFSTGDREI